MDNSFVPKGWTDEIQARVSNIASALSAHGIDALLLADNVNLYYTSGRVFSGYTYITADGRVHYFVRRPVGFENQPDVDYVHKPELIPSLLACQPQKVALLADSLTQLEWQRLSKVFPEAEVVDGTALMRQIRSVKTPFEHSLLNADGIHHQAAYSRIPSVFRLGMTDIQLQIEIERLLREEGCLGLFRVHGSSMEIFMASVLAGDNADNPSPYDFAMCGAGPNLSIPVGANGTVLEEGMAVMVDACGNFNGYMTDMTRTYRIGNISDLAIKAHELSISVNHALAENFGVGSPAKSLYEMAYNMSEEAGMQPYFMGHRQKAGFVGHGVGIEVNEAPVLAPRSKDILVEGQVIAIEPKYVIPGVGAVGVENTYIVRQDHLECITNAPEALINLL